MTLKEHYKQILSEMGKVATTPKEKKLAAHYGDKNKITRGDVITAARKKKGLDESSQLDEVSPPGLEKFTGSKKVKKSFAKQYDGKKGKKIMYATAWKKAKAKAK